MRIKLQSFQPLPVFRAWFSIHSATTVGELKSVLCAELPALRDGGLKSRDISLELDKFELLDFSPIDVIRDGDLILIEQRSSAPGGKRKGVFHDGRPPPKRVKRSNDTKKLTQTKRASLQKIQQSKASAVTQASVREIGANSSSSSSNTSSDSSSSSTSNSSEPDADSDSDSTSSESSSESSGSSSTSDSSDSATSSAPSSAPIHKPNGSTTPGPSQAKPTQNTAAKKLAQDKAPITASTFVSPGFGKPVTHSRNVRRRRKRMFERLAATAEPSSVNDIPLGTRAQTVPDAPVPVPVQLQSESNGRVPAAQGGRPPVFMMSTLQNKNKKKGFKKAMNSNIPAKIVFSPAGEEATVERTLQEAIPFTNTEDREVLATFSRLVPPSEKQEKGLLPPHMFVTSVDVEADMPHKRKRNKQQHRADVYDEDVVQDFDLPYDDPMEAVPAEAPAPSPTGAIASTAASTGINRQEVDSNWASLPQIKGASMVKPGMFIGWKELGINPQTFTPEMLLNVGRVVACEQQLVVEQHFEHVAAEVSFGGLIIAEEEQKAELGCDWADVFQGDWRIIQA
ncbi:hypothetical protein DAEQUDRAFT_729578 [Daedalea quercina L-15889]|uniref:Uncharacterized protein n=1 Tax=Daedalea quercina L-15889 TaxID=1314783 RepID=A0A165NHL0_9APHY|nr:hypothetical protein DAEQUDRAFT_729578 [Daedalea quercina L-15889]